VVAYVGRLVGVPAEELGQYEWDGRTIKDHRADIRKYFGFRECSVADADKAAQWLATDVCEKERQVDRVRAELLAHLKEERIEPPTRDRVRRIIGTGLRQAEKAQTARICARIPDEAVTRLLALVAKTTDPAEAPPPYTIGLGQDRIDHVERDDLGEFPQMAGREHATGHRDLASDDRLDHTGAPRNDCLGGQTAPNRAPLPTSRPTPHRGHTGPKPLTTRPWPLGEWLRGIRPWSLRKNPLEDHGDHCYSSGGRARERGGGTRERIDMGAPLRGHGRAIGRPGAPFKSTPERHDHAIHF
jgi:hypothetical protein